MRLHRSSLVFFLLLAILSIGFCLICILKEFGITVNVVLVSLICMVWLRFFNFDWKIFSICLFSILFINKIFLQSSPVRSQLFNALKFLALATAFLALSTTVQNLLKTNQNFFLLADAYKTMYCPKDGSFYVQKNKNECLKLELIEINGIPSVTVSTVLSDLSTP